MLHDNSRISVLHLMLKPIVRFVFRGAHSIQEFIEVLKLVYLDVAKEQMEKDGIEVYASRLVMATGIHRIEINRLLRENKSHPDLKGNMLFRIIGQWEQHRSFRNKDGSPKVLTFKGENSQFAKLLKSVSASLTVGATLFELERIGAVERTPKGLALVGDMERQAQFTAEKFEVMAKDVQDLLNAAEQNLAWPREQRREGEVGNVYLRTEYNNIFEDRLPEIRAWLVAESKEFHRKVRDYLSQFDQDVVDGPGKAGAQVMIHGFSVTEPDGRKLSEEKLKNQ